MIVKHEYLFLAASAISMGGFIGSFADEKSQAKPIVVTMKSLSYEPKKLEVHVGDSVVWTNGSLTTHTAVSDDDGKSFDTGEVEPEKSSKPIKFDKEGEFKYHCTVHGKHMSGTIIVK